MRLADRIAQYRHPLMVSRPGLPSLRLPGVAESAAQVASVPLRYVLGDDVRDVCAQLIDRWTDLLDPADPLLRVPAPSLWMEWLEVRAEGNRMVGTYVESDASGRRGWLRSFWDDGGTGIDLSQAILHFDLDGLPAVPAAGTMYRWDARHYGALGPVMACATAAIVPEWTRYFASCDCAPSARQQALAGCAAQVWFHLPMLLGFVRLLQMGQALSERPVIRDRLNAARQRRGKAPLLDHIELTLKLGDQAAGGAGTQPVRGRCRRHLVRGHLVRRGGRIFWRSAHARGRADLPGVLSRTTSLMLASRGTQAFAPSSRGQFETA